MLGRDCAPWTCLERARSLLAACCACGWLSAPGRCKIGLRLCKIAIRLHGPREPSCTRHACHNGSVASLHVPRPGHATTR
ncbi:hypothetical protein COCCADRAFT_96056 [Bipolaris zeicola 26-R-13]|uniref:Uncharacterized protein n=1 Tax=Cochliobolus carbonum (strain 26-R-13) TaxID=930089 RepID=W6YPS8_COCC2|nr:uncharacterized protein COCCADRAFT_96056 [Bipolaris zeicola 26-R-13]EUC33456.1 hypothetical protein COCCADRAFT_96056 [Bipolaris zeicola 26-R-13]